MVIIIVRFARAAVFMKFRGSRENIFSHSCLHATWRRRSVCPLLSDRETNRDSFISVSLFFFLLSCFVYSVLCLFIQSGIFGVLSNKQEEERLRWIFRGGGNLTVNQGWLFRTQVFSHFIFRNEVCIQREMWFLCVYIRICLDLCFRWSSRLFLPRLSIVYLWIFQRLYINDVKVFWW